MDLCSKNNAFSLAELLIALAILAVIAMFSIPKILSSNNSAKKMAVFKETLSAMQNLLYDGRRDGSITSAPTYQTYMLNHVNATLICSTNSSTQGCWDTSVQGTPSGDTARPGFIFANGARVIGIENALNADGSDGIWMDWNGLDLPNTVGDDQLKIYACVTGPTCTNIDVIRPRTPGFIGPAGNAPHPALYDQIFP